MRSTTARLIAQSPSGKYYNEYISALNENEQEQIENLVVKLEAAGAVNPLSWACSEATEGIPQFARFRVLQELYLHASEVSRTLSCAHDFDRNIGEDYKTFAATIGHEKLDQFLMNFSKGLVYKLLDVVDEGNVHSGRDGFSWRLMKTNERGDEVHKGIDGLHENFMEFQEEIKP